MVFAAIHTVVGVVLFGDWLLLIAQDGIGNLTWTPETLAAFWFLIFSWPVWLLGYTVSWACLKTGQLARLQAGGFLSFQGILRYSVYK